MKYPVKLSQDFKPVRANLIRLGGNHDGGYCIDRDILESSNGLLSFGINDDWRFERDFSLSNAGPVVCYDGSVSQLNLIKILFKKIINLHPYWSIIITINSILTFKRFFTQKNTFRQNFVGKKGRSLSWCIEDYVKTYDEGFFCKIDIEGEEYRILEELEDYLDKLTGVLIEFHDFDLHEERIRKFLLDNQLEIFFININNYEEKPGYKMRPRVVELGFAKNKSLGNKDFDEAINFYSNKPGGAIMSVVWI